MESLQNQIGGRKKNPHEKFFLSMQMIFGTMAFCLSLVAAIVMVTSKQSATIFGVIMDAKFTYSPAFKYFVGVNALAAAYSLLSMPFVFRFSHQSSDLWGPYVKFVLDLIVMGLLIGGCSASSAIGYVALKGNSHTGWSPVCDYFGKFCNRAQISIICSFLAILPFFLQVVTFVYKTPDTQ